MRRVNFWVSEQLLAAFDQVAKERDMTRTQLLRRVMTEMVLLAKKRPKGVDVL